MRSAFGVDHTPEEISKLALKPITTAFKTGWKNPNIKMTPGGAGAAIGLDGGAKGMQLKAAQAGSHLQRNKTAYAAGTAGTAAGAGVASVAQPQRRNRF